MYDGVTTMLHELIPLASEHKKVMAVIITDGIVVRAPMVSRVVKAPEATAASSLTCSTCDARP